MTKRFTRCKSECKVKVYDEVTQEIIPAMRVVELMNELYEKDKDGEECYRKLLAKYDKLKEENGQLKQQLKEEQCRTRPITLNTHISDEDFKRIELLLKKYLGEHSIDEKLLDDLYFNQVGGI